MFRQWLDGVNQTPVYDWARQLGVNTIRTFSMLGWAGLHPSNYSDDQLLVFAHEVGSRGLRLELVALADCAGWIDKNGTKHPGLMPDHQDQQRHVDRLADVLGDLPHVFLELANEPSHPTNQLDPLSFTHPGRGMWSRGSTHADERPIKPPWEYGTDHTPRDNEWPRKAKNLLEASVACDGIPYVGDEPKKIRSNELTPSDCADYSAVADLLAAGSTIHTQSLGIDGFVPNGLEQACCEAWASSWRSVPSYAQLGQYTAGHLADCPIEHNDAMALRTYARLHENRATVVVVRPGLTWDLQARPGWRVAWVWGHVIGLEAV